MRRILFILAFFVFFLSFPASAQTQTCRDPKLWPFAQNSIWNMPIGSGAQFVAANVRLPSNGYDPEENIIIMTPTAPQRRINNMVSAGWDGSQQARCASTGQPMGGSSYPLAPIPNDLVTLNKLGGLQPNAAAAILLPDNETVIQNQPLTICSAGGEVLSKYPYATVNVKTGDGIKGAQGGTGMSSIGGAIRIHEMVAGETINHALKIVIYGVENLYYDRSTNIGYRWPAYQHDSGAEPGDCSQGNDYCGTNPAFKIGALLALPPSVDINSLGLTSQSGKMIAKAMQDYGAYAVDNSGWSNIGIAVEWGPAGDGKAKWNGLGGFNNSDLDKIFSRVQIVNNNSPTAIGGGGTPRVALAPPLCGAGVTPGVTLSPVVSNTPGGSCAKKSQGDANCDGFIRVNDYVLWRSEFLKTATTKNADFNADGEVRVNDFVIWRTSFMRGAGVPPGGGACVGGRGGSIKIMPLGDSVTAGDDRGGYRFKLYSLLKEINVNFDFVGPNSSGSVQDNNHAGFGGYQLGRVTDVSHGEHMISKEIPSIIPQYGPDVVLLAGGVNDMYGGWANTPWQVPEVSANMLAAVDQIATLNPGATIIVAALSRWGPQDNGDPNRVAINNAIKIGVTTRKNQGKNVVFAETMGSSLTAQDNPVDVHPVAAGYDKMADIWFSYLDPLLCK